MARSMPMGPRPSVVLKVAAVVIMMPPMATAVVARNQSKVFAKSDRMGFIRVISYRGGILGALAELITDAANGLDDLPAALQFLAQMADVHVDGAVKGRGFAVVEAFHQAVARYDPPGIAHQLFQDIEFQGGHFHRLSVASDFARAGI